MSARAAIRAEIGDISPFDVHAHTGADIDGSTRTAEEHVAALDGYEGRSTIFPLCVNSGYAAENRRVVAECGRHPELTPFARLDPQVDGGAEAAAALAGGARGFKLHPRSEGFRLEHPGVDAILAVAAEAGAPVVVHAGLGVGSLGEPIVALAERHRGCPIVLAHAAISDLGWLWPEVPAHPNLFFDTAWWNLADVAALFALVPPGRILFGSDAPYMDFEFVLALTLRCARFGGLSPEAVELVAGGQLDRLLAGEAPVDAGPPPGWRREAPSPAVARLAAALTAAGGAFLGGGDTAQMLELAGLAVDAVEGELAGPPGAIAELLEEAGSGGEDAPWALAMAMALVLTPGLENPALAA